MEGTDGDYAAAVMAMMLMKPKYVDVMIDDCWVVMTVSVDDDDDGGAGNGGAKAAAEKEAEKRRKEQERQERYAAGL